MTEMGLAVVQQLKSFEPSFEPGALAGLFDQAGSTPEKQNPVLRLVENVGRNFSYATDGAFDEFEGFDDHAFRNEVLNIKSHEDIVEEDTLQYAIREHNKPPELQDFNYSGDNGYDKGPHRSADLSIQNKRDKDWRQAFQMTMELQRNEATKRLQAELDALRRRLDSIDKAQKVFDKLSQDDLKGDTVESRAKIEEAKQAWADAGMNPDKIPMQDGQIDLDAAKKALEDEKRETQQRYDDLDKERKTVLANQESSSNKLAAVKDVDNVSIDDGFEAADSSNDEEFDVAAVNGIELKEEQTQSEIADISTLATQSQAPLAPASISAPDEIPNMLANSGFVNREEVNAAPSAATGARSFSSAASSIDGKDTRIISQSFTELAAGLMKPPAPIPEAAPSSANDQTYSVMRVS